MKMNKFTDHVITFWKRIYLSPAVAFSLYLANGLYVDLRCRYKNDFLFKMRHL